VPLAWLARLALALPFPASGPPRLQEAVQEPEKGENGEKRERRVERVVLPRASRALLYMELSLTAPDPGTPMLVLYHQARSSKGEYRPIVPRLQALGYNCLSVDLSCGGTSRDVKNLSARKAKESGRNPTYLDALPEIQDSLRWAREKHAHGKLVAWGSSYSAALALCVAAESPELVDGVVAFSPGEYFTALGKSATWVRESVASLACPVFVSSSRREEADWRPIFEAIPAATKTSFLPSGPGEHGSRALWEESPGHAEYWAALEAFLRQHFPVAAPAPTSGPPTEDG
jgi:pimeloyl-ACP methyl ester carboxylesterase